MQQYADAMEDIHEYGPIHEETQWAGVDVQERGTWISPRLAERDETATHGSQMYAGQSLNSQLKHVPERS